MYARSLLNFKNEHYKPIKCIFVYKIKEMSCWNVYWYGVREKKTYSCFLLIYHDRYHYDNKWLCMMFRVKIMCASRGKESLVVCSQCSFRLTCVCIREDMWNCLVAGTSKCALCGLRRPILKSLFLSIFQYAWYSNNFGVYHYVLRDK